MDLEKCRYIVVEGPIGAGKTSLARQLATHLAGDALLTVDLASIGGLLAGRTRYAEPRLLG